MQGKNTKLSIIAVSILSAGLLFCGTRFALAGPITGGAVTKFSIYQGVLSIVPTNTTAMEIGNLGTDIAGTGDLYFRPGALAHSAATNAYFTNTTGKVSLIAPGQGTQLGYLTVLTQTAPNEGGEIQLQPGSGAYFPWFIDSYQDRFRVYANGTERLSIATSTGNTYIVNGSLCFGAVGSTNCSNTWAAAGTPTLDSVLGAGNTSSKHATLGATVGPVGTLAVNSDGTTGTGGANDSIAAYANGNGSAVYAQQDGFGYAGYFSGRSAAYGPITSASSLNSTFAVLGGYPSGINTSIGLATWGGTPVSNGTSYSMWSRAAGNTAANNFSSYGLYSLGGDGGGSFGTNWTTYAVYADAGGAGGAGNTTYGLYARGGAVAAGGVSWAGYFQGSVVITTGVQIGPTAGLKQSTGTFVCQIGNNTCLGRYLYTSGTVRDTSASGVKYCYERTSDSTIQCQLAYKAGSAIACSNPANILRQRSTSGVSYWISDGTCAPGNGEYMPLSDVNGGVQPHGAAGTYACIDGLTDYGNLSMLYKNAGACASFNSSLTGARRVTNSITTSTYTQDYELR